jgi:acyl-CoA thioester hydrolase
MYSHRSQIRVRYAETDQMGVVHHSVYPIWFEAARSDLFRSLGVPYGDFECLDGTTWHCSRKIAS